MGQSPSRLRILDHRSQDGMYVLYGQQVPMPRPMRKTTELSGKTEAWAAWASSASQGGTPHDGSLNAPSCPQESWAGQWAGVEGP